MAEKGNASRTPSRVRDARPSDLGAVVGVHRIAFRGFFLDQMGPRFLRAYYASIIDFPQAIFLVHEDEACRVDGFAVGFLDPEAYYAHFRSRRLRMAPIIALALLRRPNLLVEIARNTRRVSSVKPGSNATVELSSIGTRRHGAGIGSHLLRAFCDRSREMGAREIVLTTDRDHNEGVLSFYLAHGFEKGGIEARGRRVLQIMFKSLGEAAPSAAVG